MLVVVDYPAICWSVLIIDDPLESALSAPITLRETLFDSICPY